MKSKYFFLKIMVFSMKWMTRYMGFIAIPFVRWYADREVIACGLRSKNGDVNIIYSPKDNKMKYSFLKKEGKKWIKIDVFSVKKFSNPIVHQVKIPKAKLNEVYRVYTKNKENKKNLHSPDITIKKDSIDLSNIINIKLLNKEKLKISWEEGDSYDPMIYFLVVENNKRETLSAIYTRDNFWTYPLVKKTSLSLLNNPPKIDKSKIYIKLIIVDFDGWATGMGSKVFHIS